MMQSFVLWEAEIWFNNVEFRDFFTASKNLCGLQGCDGLLVVGVESLAFANINQCVCSIVLDCCQNCKFVWLACLHGMWITHGLVHRSGALVAQ